MPGYCAAWNVFVKLGLTDDSWKLPNWGEISWPQLLNTFLPGTGEIKKRLKNLMGYDIDETILNKLEWLGILMNKIK